MDTMTKWIVLKNWKFGQFWKNRKKFENFARAKFKKFENLNKNFENLRILSLRLKEWKILKNWTKSKTKLKNVHFIEKTVNVKYFALLKKWSMRTWCQQKRKLTSAVHIGSMSQSSWSMSILTQLKHKSHPVKFCPVFHQ